MSEVKYYLYKITNRVNGKLYIGVTKDPEYRKRSHFRKGERLVNKACEKYGKDKLTFEIICIGAKDYIYDLEVKAIKLYNSDSTTGHGYNICSGGFKGDAGNKGRKHKYKSDDLPHYVSGFWFPNKRTALSCLGWGTGKFNSRKKSGSLGEECVLQKRFGPQTDVYVSGFWFPSKKVATTCLSMTPAVYERLRVEGILGSTEQPARKSNSTAIRVPNYFKGFWFPDLYIAAKVFNMRPEAIRQRILRGSFEERGGKTENTQTREYLILGKTFKSIEEASIHFNIPPTTVKNRVSRGTPGYGYIHTIKEFQIGT